MKVHLIDGTYELFRHFYGAPPRENEQGEPVGAVVGVLSSLLQLINQGATHLGVATDHVVESFRNTLYQGYKTGEGIEPELQSQFGPLETALVKMGIPVWAMTDWEADDGLAAAARQSSEDSRVEQVIICTPDKDLAQCVQGDRIVQLDRRQGILRNAQGVMEKFGVPPASIPDYLALVGDSADGFPGISGWGAKSTSTVLAEYGHLENIPKNPQEIEISLRGKDRLINNLSEGWKEALLFRDLATLRSDRDLFPQVDALQWTGPNPDFYDWCRHSKAENLGDRAAKLAAKLS